MLTIGVLVTGGCGLVGSLIVRELVRLGQRTVVYDLVPQATLLQDVLPSITVTKGDILDLTDLLRVIQEEQIDRVIHAASFLSPGVLERPYAGVKTNVMGALHVYEAARLAKLRRVVFTSTGKVRVVGRRYGESLDEGQPALDADPYASSKVSCELLANDYRRTYGLDIVVARFCGQIFGPGHAFAGGLGKALQGVLQGALDGEPVALRRVRTNAPSSGEEPISLLYARDAAHGAVAAALADGASSSVFNITGLESRSIAEMGDAIEACIPGAKVETPSSSRSGTLTPVDPRVEREIGYRPHYSFSDGLKEAVAFLMDGSLLYG